MNPPISLKTVVIFFCLLSAGNLLLLDYLYISAEKAKPGSPSDLLTVPQTQPTPLPTEPPAVCPSACLDLISQVSSSGPTPATAKSTPRKQEFSVSFGGGSSRAGDWTDIPAAEAYIDGTKYAKILETVFEAGVQIPNGNQTVSVRLFNVTDQHPVWFSEVFHSGSEPKLLISPPITLEAAPKLYRVQLKTSMKDLAVLTEARVRITSLVQ